MESGGRRLGVPAMIQLRVSQQRGCGAQAQGGWLGWGNELNVNTVGFMEGLDELVRLDDNDHGEAREAAVEENEDGGVRVGDGNLALCTQGAQHNVEEGRRSFFSMFEYCWTVELGCRMCDYFVKMVWVLYSLIRLLTEEMTKLGACFRSK